MRSSCGPNTCLRPDGGPSTKETRANVASHRMKRAFRVAASVTAAVAVVSVSPSPALALPPAQQQPPPDTASEAMAQYKKLTKQAEQVNEDLLAARTDLDKKRAQLTKATADLANAKAAMAQAAADEEAFRGKVDVLTNASFQGARFNKLSALLTGSSADDFLERAAALGVLASDNEEALSKLTGAVNMATDAQAKAAAAQKSATDATTAAKALIAKITKTKTNLDAQISKVKDAYNEPQRRGPGSAGRARGQQRLPRPARCGWHRRRGRDAAARQDLRLRRRRPGRRSTAPA